MGNRRRFELGRCLWRRGPLTALPASRQAAPPPGSAAPAASARREAQRRAHRGPLCGRRGLGLLLRPHLPQHVDRQLLRALGDLRPHDRQGAGCEVAREAPGASGARSEGARRLWGLRGLRGRGRGGPGGGWCMRAAGEGVAPDLSCVSASWRWWHEIAVVQAVGHKWHWFLPPGLLHNLHPVPPGAIDFYTTAIWCQPRPVGVLHSDPAARRGRISR